jgi:hypothetical protein
MTGNPFVDLLGQLAIFSLNDHNFAINSSSVAASESSGLVNCLSWN